METNQARRMAREFVTHWCAMDGETYQGCPEVSTEDHYPDDCLDCLITKLLAAYGSSEYERGLRDGLERAAKRMDELGDDAHGNILSGYREDVYRHVAASIRQIK